MAKGGGSGGGAPGFVWLIGGFALGVIVTVLYRVGTPLPMTGAKTPSGAAATPTTAPAAAPATDWTFDSILGGLEVVVPGRIKPEVKPADPAHPVAAPVYALQVGAFRTEPEADRLRAELALLGFEARIQKATIDDKDTWFRVRIGPFKDAVEFERARARLDENKIKSVQVRSGP